ncbi:MAG: putative Ig domain-containing protein, partial [Acidobacteriota bacterium]|nr:putative Ig domain-containing protein [Acidobacteriota bacterium]
GILGGTPTASGTTSFSVQVADGSGNTASKIFQVQIVAAPSITTTSPLPSGTLNRGYTSLTLTETGGTAPFQWTGSGLPAGLSVSSAGVLSGTPTSTGTSTISITVTDAVGATASATFPLSVYSQLTISSASPLPVGTVSSAYNFAFQAGGGTGQYTWSISSGSLPGGLALAASTGIVSGTPSATGTANFVVTVHDGSGGTATGSFALTINSGLSITSNSPLAQGEVSRPYSVTFAGTGGSGSYTWSVPSGSSLPPGLTLSPGGTLGGTPTASGTNSFSVQIADGSGVTATKAFQLQIVAAPSIATAPPLPPGTLNTAYSQITFTGTGGTPPFQWTSSALPAGLTLTTAGLLSGTPSSAGTSNISITLTDAAGATASASYSLTVYSQLTVASASPLPAGAVSSAYSFTFQAGGGSGSYTWSVGTGSLPSGLTLSPSTGQLSGTPTATGTSSFLIQVSDLQRESTASKSFSLTLNNGLSIISSSPLTTGEASRPYSSTFTATGGSGSYTWSLPSGSNLPAGLTLSPGGALSGTPTGAATASFSIQVADASGNTVSKNFQLQIVAAPSITTGSPLPPGTPNRPYSALTFAESGGTGPFQWSSSQLPSGLTLTSGGVLSGTPTSAGTTLFSITLTDGVGGTASATFSLSVVSQLTITSGSPLAPGTVGSVYSFTFQVGGGSGSYSWSIVSGSLPAGLSLSSGGILSGTPSGGGNFTFAVQVTDVQSNDLTTKTFSIAVTGNFTITNAATLPNGTAGANYTQQLTTSGGFGSVTWSAVSALPAGLTLASSGLISGTPSAPGTFTFNVQASDGATPADTSTEAFTIVIATAIPPLVITSPATLSGQLGTTYSFMFTATGGTPPYVWSVNGALPAGLGLASASGVVSGKASGVGPYSLTIQVTDSTGRSASRLTQLQFTLPPAPPLQITGIPSNPAANSQPTFQITIASPFSFDIQGTLSLSFSSPSGIDDPAIQFTNGTRNLGFTIPAGSTTAVYAAGESPVFLTGTIAGTITLTTTQYQALGASLSPVPAPVQVVIPPTAPVIISVTAARGSGGFTVTVVGYSPTREVTAGTFSFLGSNLDTPQLSVDLSTLFQGWFSSTSSDQFGSQFKLTQPFNLNGGSGNVKSVSVTLTNSIGGSVLVTAPVE